MDIDSNPYTPLNGSVGSPSYQKARLVRVAGLATVGLLLGGVAVYTTTTSTAAAPHTGNLETMSSGPAQTKGVSSDAVSDASGYVPMFTKITSILSGAPSSVAQDEVDQAATNPAEIMTKRAKKVATPAVVGGDKSDWGLQSITLTYGETLYVSGEAERRLGRPLGDGYAYPETGLDNRLFVRVGHETTFEFGRKTTWSLKQTDATTKQSVNVYTHPEESESLALTIEDPGKYTIVVGGQEATVDARVVRYEVRDLSDDDRNAYLDALHTMYYVNDEEGAQTYGDRYKSAAWLVRQHLYGAASRECDHWHDDAGVINHHVGITWELENILRTIDSSTAAHYWDYTREAAEDIEWYDSPFFDDDWFGATSPIDGEKIITKGRWAYLPVMESARSYSNITNPYGLLRSPWNTDNTPYVMRHNATLWSFADGNTEFPTCSNFKTAAEYDWIGTMFNRLNGELHGPVHLMIGGHWGWSEKWREYMVSVSETDGFLLFAKFLWRQGFIHTPDYCSSDTPQSECTTHCPDEVKDGMNASEILKVAGAHRLIEADPYWDSLSTYGHTHEDLLDALCSIGHPGEMFSSAAPYDPIFWPLHGTAERFMGLMRVSKARGLATFSEKWGYAHNTYNPSDTDTYCDWSGIDQTNSFERPTCIRQSCSGHREDDTLPFEGLWSGQSGLYTNSEFYEFSSPLNDDMPYMYDSLEYWAGCGDMLSDDDDE